MLTLDQIAERAKDSRAPLRSCLPPNPGDTEMKVLMSAQFTASYLIGKRHFGAALAFASRLEHLVKEIRATIERDA